MFKHEAVCPKENCDSFQSLIPGLQCEDLTLLIRSVREHSLPRLYIVKGSQMIRQSLLSCHEMLKWPAS